MCARIAWDSGDASPSAARPGMGALKIAMQIPIRSATLRIFKYCPSMTLSL
jgi:hypothetical protein